MRDDAGPSVRAKISERKQKTNHFGMDDNGLLEAEAKANSRNDCKTVPEKMMKNCVNVEWIDACVRACATRVVVARSIGILCKHRVQVGGEVKHKVYNMFTHYYYVRHTPVTLCLCVCVRAAPRVSARRLEPSHLFLIALPYSSRYCIHHPLACRCSHSFSCSSISNLFIPRFY